MDRDMAAGIVAVAQSGPTETAGPKGQRLYINYRQAVEMLSWFARLTTMTPEAIQAGQRLFTWVQAHLPQKQQAQLRAAMERVAAGWRPGCPFCGRRMRELKNEHGRAVAGTYECTCGAWLGRDLAPGSGDAPVTPLQLYRLELDWKRRCIKRGHGGGRSSRKRRYKRRPRGPILPDDAD